MNKHRNCFSALRCRFLEKNNLHALSGFLMFAHAAQGYGYVTSIPAFYGLWWISPESWLGIDTTSPSLANNIQNTRIWHEVGKTRVRLKPKVWIGGCDVLVARLDGFGLVSLLCLPSHPGAFERIHPDELSSATGKDLLFGRWSPEQPGRAEVLELQE